GPHAASDQAHWKNTLDGYANAGSYSTASPDAVPPLSALIVMLATPPTSLEPSGGVYCTYSLSPTLAAPPMGESSPYIGHRALSLEPASGVPVDSADQPSLGAADPSGLTQDTWIHVP